MAPAAGRRRAGAAAAARGRRVLATGGERHRQAQPGGEHRRPLERSSSSCASVVLPTSLGPAPRECCERQRMSLRRRGANHTESVQETAFASRFGLGVRDLLCLLPLPGSGASSWRQLGTRPTGWFSRRRVAASTPTVQRADRHELDQSCDGTCATWTTSRSALRRGLHPSPTREQHDYSASPGRITLRSRVRRSRRRVAVAGAQRDRGDDGRDPGRLGGPGSWASSTSPTTVAVAGSSASSTANRAVPTRRSTTWSSTYGTTLDSTPTPSPSTSTAGSTSVAGPPGIAEQQHRREQHGRHGEAHRHVVDPVAGARDPRAEQDVGRPHRRGRQRPHDPPGRP